MCSEKPGEFKWQPGTLCQALEHGSWLVLEDIDTAPADVISTLVTIIKTKSLKIHSLGKEIQAAEGFQIFATSRCVLLQVYCLKQVAFCHFRYANVMAVFLRYPDQFTSDVNII